MKHEPIKIKIEIELDAYDYFDKVPYGERIKDFLDEFYPARSSRNEDEENSLLDNLFDIK